MINPNISEGPKIYLAFDQDRYRVVVNGLAISTDRASPTCKSEALSLAYHRGYKVAEVAWNGDEGSSGRCHVMPKIYHTSYCNFGHRMSDGAPVDHECYVLPPKALLAEQVGDTNEAIRLIEDAKPLRTMRRGVKR